MPNRIHVAFVAALLTAAAFGIAQQTSTKIRTVSIQPTSAASGKQMYMSYCAVCHGTDGRGNGPAVAALKSAPTDLTALARDHGGKFPEGHVMSVLQFGVRTPAHGVKEMPIWGPALRSLDTNLSSPDMEEHQRIANLTNYLKSLQQ